MVLFVSRERVGNRSLDIEIMPADAAPIVGVTIHAGQLVKAVMPVGA